MWREYFRLCTRSIRTRIIYCVIKMFLIWWLRQWHRVPCICWFSVLCDRIAPCLRFKGKKVVTSPNAFYSCAICENRNWIGQKWSIEIEFQKVITTHRVGNQKVAITNETAHCLCKERQDHNRASEREREAIPCMQKG